MDIGEFKAAGVCWDLGGLYTSPDDAQIEIDLMEARRCAEALAQTYRGKIESGQIDGPTLARALAEYEAIAELQQFRVGGSCDLRTKQGRVDQPIAWRFALRSNLCPEDQNQ